MEVILSDGKGARREAVILAGGNDRLRVMLRDDKDAVELRREGDKWISEDQSVFEVDAWIVSGTLQPESLCAEILQRTLAA